MSKKMMMNQNLEPNKKEDVIIDNSSIRDLWKSWKRIPYTKLISIDQRFANNIIVEFAININEKKSFIFLKDITKLVIEKSHPGTISWIGHYSQNLGSKDIYDNISTQFKKYRVEFFDSYENNKNIDDINERIKLFFNAFVEFIQSR